MLTLLNRAEGGATLPEMLKITGRRRPSALSSTPSARKGEELITGKNALGERCYRLAARNQRANPYDLYSSYLASPSV